MYTTRSLLDQILALLDGEGVPYEVLHHAATRTSEASARVRGEDLAVGAKALVLKTGADFRLFVLSAATRLDSRKVKKLFGVKKVRFATTDELMAMTGLVPGAVPPFGTPLLPFDLFVDQALLANTRVAFNAGSLTASVIMARSDYIRLAAPTVLDFAQRPPDQEA